MSFKKYILLFLVTVACASVLSTHVLSTQDLSSHDLSPYVRKSWCTSIMYERKIGLELRQVAADLGLDLRLLAVGISSEGVATEKDRQVYFDHVDSNAVLSGFKIDSSDVGVPTDFLSEGWKYFFYNRNWQVDGTDTFALSFERLKLRGYIPQNWKLESLTGSSVILLGARGADLVVNWQARNENARERYVATSMNLPFFKRPRQNPTQGDPGMIFYRTPYIEAVANAALWKYQIDLHLEARKTILDHVDEFGFLSEERELVLKGLARPLTRNEEIFWAKVFFNTAQGTQAAAYNFLVAVLRRGILLSPDYLSSLDPEVGYRVLYHNARHVLDSYLYAESIGCPQKQ